MKPESSCRRGAAKRLILCFLEAFFKAAMLFFSNIMRDDWYMLVSDVCL